jgi:hypothetical protein
MIKKKRKLKSIRRERGEKGGVKTSTSTRKK